MQNILLKISYDGGDLCGWQRQDHEDKNASVRTVQQEIEDALEKIHKQKTILYGSGRTDSGVHALAQAANFYSPVPSMKPENYIRALNSFLPKDIRILEAKSVESDFNARFSATSRTYRYFISYGNAQNAAMTRYTWNVHHVPDMRNLNEMASLLKGEMDCASFTASGDESLSTFRYLEHANFFMQKSFPDGKDLLVFEIQANAFLWKMVRTITGTLIDLDKNGKGLEDFRSIIEAKDRKKAGVTAPADGLFLYDISFDGERRHV